MGNEMENKIYVNALLKSPCGKSINRIGVFSRGERILNVVKFMNIDGYRLSKLKIQKNRRDK
jgi:hypothetical protein